MLIKLRSCNMAKTNMYNLIYNIFNVSRPSPPTFSLLICGQILYYLLNYLNVRT